VKLGNTTNPAAAVFTVTGRVIKSIGGWIPTTPGSGIRIPPMHQIKVERIEEAR
jgi:hypothetical protein